MLILLNTTKTMNLSAPVPSPLNVTEPCQMKLARLLADKVSRMNCSQLKELMLLSTKLANETRENAVCWGLKDNPKIPALFAFTGLCSMQNGSNESGRRMTKESCPWVMSRVKPNPMMLCAI